jgi:hypothetical protein
MKQEGRLQLLSVPCLLLQWRMQGVGCQTAGKE